MAAMSAEGGWKADTYRDVEVGGESRQRQRQETGTRDGKATKQRDRAALRDDPAKEVEETPISSAERE
jgi:hypothetical protein